LTPADFSAGTSAMCVTPDALSSALLASEVTHE
jgi:hypothetical protein